MDDSGQTARVRPQLLTFFDGEGCPYLQLKAVVESNLLSAEAALPVRRNLRFRTHIRTSSQVDRGYAAKGSPCW
jgi:hypothetical protein